MRSVRRLWFCSLVLPWPRHLLITRHNKKTVKKIFSYCLVNVCCTDPNYTSSETFAHFCSSTGSRFACCCACILTVVTSSVQITLAREHGRQSASAILDAKHAGAIHGAKCLQSRDIRSTLFVRCQQGSHQSCAWGPSARHKHHECNGAC